MSLVLPLVCACVVAIVFVVALFVWFVLHGTKELRPYPETTRLALFLIVATLSGVELHHVCMGRMCDWMGRVILVGNVWGFLDAVLRFPRIYNVNAFFTLKQCLLVALKVICLTYSFKDLNYENMVWLFALLLVNILFPLVYVMALPVEDDAVEQRLAAHDVVDVDLALRVIELATNRQRRLDCYGTFKRKVCSTAVNLVTCSSLAERAVSYSLRLPSSPPARSTRRGRCV